MMEIEELKVGAVEYRRAAVKGSDAEDLQEKCARGIELINNMW